MRIASLTTHRIRLPFVAPMVTAYGRYDTRLMLLVRVETADDVVGWGECSSFEDSAYFWETVDIADKTINNLTQSIVGAHLEASGVASFVRSVQSDAGPMSVSAVEMAVLDAELKTKSQSLVDYLAIPVGDGEVMVSVVLGIPVDRSVETLVSQVAAKVEQGVRAVKLKIEPGWDVEPVRALQARFGKELNIIVDANGSFAGADHKPLYELSELDVIIEQPLAKDDFEGHAALVAAGVKRICLDESVEEPADARRAVEKRAAHILCLKPSRIGGILALRALQSECDALGIETRIGGMYSSAIGSIAARSLAAGRPQSDIMPLGMYWKNGVDLTEAEQLGPNGTVPVSTSSGIGVEVNEEFVQQLAASSFS